MLKENANWDVFSFELAIKPSNGLNSEIVDDILKREEDRKIKEKQICLLRQSKRQEQGMQLRQRKKKEIRVKHQIQQEKKCEIKPEKNKKIKTHKKSNVSKVVNQIKVDCETAKEDNKIIEENKLKVQKNIQEYEEKQVANEQPNETKKQKSIPMKTILSYIYRTLAELKYNMRAGEGISCNQLKVELSKKIETQFSQKQLSDSLKQLNVRDKVHYDSQKGVIYL